MSSMLDRSLDDSIASSRQAARRGIRRRANRSTAAVGGVRKNTKAAKTAGHGAHNTHPSPRSESKIIVSGLPSDVNEANIKEYFTKAAGPVKRVMLTYNQNGTSRGIASIIFFKAETAGLAAKQLNGLLVDGKPMKIEVVLDAANAPGIPGPKPLSERVAQNKSRPRPATTAAANKHGRRTRRGNTNRPRKKNVEELDAEMTDYYLNSENAGPAEGNATANGAHPSGNTGGDLGMAEIS